MTNKRKTSIRSLSTKLTKLMDGLKEKLPLKKDPKKPRTTENTTITETSKGNNKKMVPTLNLTEERTTSPTLNLLLN